MGFRTVGDVVGTLPLSVTVTSHDPSHGILAALAARLSGNDCDPAITGESPEEHLARGQ